LSGVPMELNNSINENSPVVWRPGAKRRQTRKV
jgi:hypothetical protein